MIEYQKIYEIDDTVSSVPDTYWHEVGRPENDNKGNSAKITEANYRQSIVNYILNNYDLLIANRYDIEGTLVSSYSIDSTDSYNSYYANVLENQKLAVSIDAPATVPGKRIKIFYNSTNYGTLPITSTGVNIRCRGVLYTTICLFTNGECVELESDGTYWNVVNNWAQDCWPGFINCSDFTNRNGGNIQLIVSDTSSYTQWEIGEELISGFRGVIAKIVDSTTLEIWRTDDGSAGTGGGYFTATRTFAEISGGLGTSTISNNTKNVDSYAYHGTGINHPSIRFFNQAVDIGIVASWDQMYDYHGDYTVAATSYASYGIAQYNTNYINIMFAYNGLLYLRESDNQPVSISSTDCYYTYKLYGKEM